MTNFFRAGRAGLGWLAFLNRTTEKSDKSPSGRVSSLVGLGKENQLFFPHARGWRGCRRGRKWRRLPLLSCRRRHRPRLQRDWWARAGEAPLLQSQRRLTHQGWRSTTSRSTSMSPSPRPPLLSVTAIAQLVKPRLRALWSIDFFFDVCIFVG